MKLSIIIVNYNVRHFLEQCLKSVYTALEGIEGEVWVVDNNSVDGSVEMVRSKFPEVKLLANEYNPGFAKANNQAIAQANGEYILLLNPDTVVEENTFRASLQLMDENPKAGGLGIKMMDGKGNFLPESKRGLPTPWVAFYKITGLASLFPHSPKFARYYLGHLSPDKNHEIEILAGAYMLLRKSALDQTGWLDEDYFMYGEDIDLSYRLTEAGYTNHYLADSSIIHYKGESTKKGSLNYVFIFYRAMLIFARKHFSGSYARLYALVINLAIYLRAGLSILSRLMKKASVPLLDAGLLAGGLMYIKEYWENNHRFIRGGEYPPELVMVAFPAYILLWLAGIFFSGGYDRLPRLMQIFKGVFFGTIAILVGYSLLPEEFRFSRAIIVLGAFWAGLALPLWRYVVQWTFKKNILVGQVQNKRILLVGRKSELQRVQELVKESNSQLSYLGFVSLDDHPDDFFIGHKNDLPDLCRVFAIDEVIFCSADVSSSEIFQQMSRLNPLNVEIKIAPPESQFIIGSNSINSQGAWYAVEFNAISKPSNKRAKRMLDLAAAVVLLIGAPVLIFGYRQKGNFLKNIFRVFAGRKSWVSYDPRGNNTTLPSTHPGILYPTDNVARSQLDGKTINNLNQLYAKDYKLQTDLNLVIGHWKKLDR